MLASLHLRGRKEGQKGDEMMVRVEGKKEDSRGCFVSTDLCTVGRERKEARQDAQKNVLSCFFYSTRGTRVGFKMRLS